MGPCFSREPGRVAAATLPPACETGPKAADRGADAAVALSAAASSQHGASPAGPAALPSCGGSRDAAVPVYTAPDEEARLRAVRALGLIGAEPKPQFDAITKLMQQMFGVPVAAVTLLDKELAFISRAGSWACSAGRAGSFCDWILVPEAPQLLVVEDARLDVRFKTNQFVVGEPHIRFYAGAPLVATVGGHRYGTLCVFDFQPRSFTAVQYQMLAHFAEILVRELERELALRMQQQQIGRLQASQHVLRAMDCFHEGIVLLDRSDQKWNMVYANDAFRAAAGMPTLLDGPAAAPTATAGSSAAGAAGGAPGGGAQGLPTPVDFWSRFALAAGTGPAPYNANLPDVAGQQNFSLAVRPLGDMGGGSAGAGGSGGPQPALTIQFRLAAAQQLRNAMPHIGVPAWVGRGDTCDALVVPAGDAARDGGAVVARQGVQQARAQGSQRQDGRYYFGIVQHGEAPPAERRSGSVAQGLLPSPPAGFGGPASASPGAGGDSRGGGPPGVRLSVGSVPSGVKPAAGSLQEAESGVGAGIPSFFQMRPAVLSEVQLGPLIGTGGNGRCFRGMWQGSRVCVKVLDCWSQECGPDEAEDPSMPGTTADMAPRTALLEALLARSLSHPHIVATFTHGVSSKKVFDCGRVHQQVWIVSEFADRGSLLDAIDRGLLTLPSGLPNLPALLAAAQDIAGALAYLHSHGCIHGDLTPSNVLLVSSSHGERRWVCKVGDFGLSTVLHNGEDVVQNASVGTVTHMPPELLACGTLAKSTDTFSFGIILLEMYHGRRAWLGTRHVQVLARAGAGVLPFGIPEDAPPGLRDLLRRCLDLEPGKRPAFQQVLSDVQAILQGLLQDDGSAAQ